MKKYIAILEEHFEDYQSHDARFGMMSGVAYEIDKNDSSHDSFFVYNPTTKGHAFFSKSRVTKPFTAKEKPEYFLWLN